MTMNYGSIGDVAATPRTASWSSSRLTLTIAGICMLCMVAVISVSELASQGEAATTLAWVPNERIIVRMNPAVESQMLYDAALDPLYNGGADPIEPYKWLGLNKDAYDPVANNPLADLPMKAAEIKDPDSEYAGKAPHDMTKSCDKTGSCVDEENVLDFLPSEEARTLKKRQPTLFPEENVWSENPLDY